MIGLYSVSAVYHIGRWQGRRAVVLHALDRANIFLLIAGTYTPFCLIVLDGVMRVTLLALIWSLAAIGMGSAIFTIRLPRWASTSLYLGMGWLSLIVTPALVRALPAAAMAFVVAGGLLYSAGAVVYALKRPDPWPRIFGFHEIFHIFVVAGSAAFLIAIWGWVVPFARG
jgi:hemolysin III